MMDGATPHFDTGLTAPLTPDQLKLFCLATKRARECIEGDGKAFPVLLVLKPDGNIDIVAANNAPGGAVSTLIKALSREGTVVFVCEAWLSEHHDENKNTAIRDALRSGEDVVMLPPSADPNRKEVVMVQLFAGERRVIRRAELTRPQGKPTLGKWMTIDNATPPAPVADIEAAKAEIARVIAYAEAHPLSVADMVQCLADGGVRPGKIPQHCCTIPEGYNCVFTIEEQLPPLGLARHLSVRQPDGKRPDEDQFIRIAEAFGFDRSRVAHMMTEDITDDNGEHAFAINILQSVNPNPPPEGETEAEEENIPPAEKRF